jgi:hypothetical protein
MSFATRLRPPIPLGWRRFAARVTTLLAGLLVLFVLVAPSDFDRFSPGAFVRIPVEGLLGLLLLLLLPERPRRVFAVLGGVGLGLLAIVKALDIGFDAVLYRPFDLVLDWPLFGPAVDYLDVTIGRVGTVATVILAVLLVGAVVVLSTLSVLRLTRIAVGRRTAATRTVAVLTVACVTFAVPGGQIIPSLPVVSDTAAAFVYGHARQVRAGLHDQEAFAAEASVDAFRDTPAEDLLTGLRGKDVVLAFVESYGRSAVEHPDLAPQVNAVLDSGTQRLRDLGYASRSAFLTSPTAGGGSWLAQATLLSGLWIDNQQRYRNLTTSDRLTLPSAFGKADWRSVGVVPGITQAWPEGEFFKYQKTYTAGNLGYQGPRFGYATMPDQYTLSAFQRAERTADHSPVMATIPLLSSHAPWSPIPSQIDWNAVGDGSVYQEMQSGADPPESIFGRDPNLVRADYGRSIEYSLNNLISYVENYGDDNLVLVFLGDHQPAQIVTGEGASKDVPITIVARDQAVVDRISNWGWDEGLKPSPQAPVTRMNEFRDKFLTAFGSQAPLAR